MSTNMNSMLWWALPVARSKLSKNDQKHTQKQKQDGSILETVSDETNLLRNK